MVQEPFLGGAPGDGLDSRPLNPVVRRAVVEHEFAAPTPPGGGVAGIPVVSLERGRKEEKKRGSGEEEGRWGRGEESDDPVSVEILLSSRFDNCCMMCYTAKLPHTHLQKDGNPPHTHTLALIFSISLSLSSSPSPSPSLSPSPTLSPSHRLSIAPSSSHGSRSSNT